MLAHTVAARSAAFTFSQQLSAISVQGSGTVNFAAPSYAIEETLKGFPLLLGNTTVIATRTPRGGFYEADSGKAPTEETGDGLMTRRTPTPTDTGPMAILARSPAGYAFGLLSLVPPKDLRLLGTGAGGVGGTEATTYLFGDSGQCRGSIRTEVWTSSQGRMLKVETTQRGARGKLIEALSLTLTRFGLPVAISAPPGATSAASSNGSTNHTGMKEIGSSGTSGSVSAVSICSP